MKLFISLLLCITLSGSGQISHRSSKKIPQSQATSKNAVDACSLLTHAEVEASEGDKVQETKGSSQMAQGIRRSECIYRTVTPSKSVSVSLFSSEDSSKKAAWNYWRQQFHSEREEAKHGDKDRGKQKSGEKEGAGPTPIPGLGEEAYWISNPVSSVLYVLQGERFVRISVGGVRKQSARLEKSKTLARAALKRM